MRRFAPGGGRRDSITEAMRANGDAKKPISGNVHQLEPEECQACIRRTVIDQLESELGTDAVELLDAAAMAIMAGPSLPFREALNQPRPAQGNGKTADNRRR